jgi:CRP-like cAMP-binding protein
MYFIANGLVEVLLENTETGDIVAIANLNSGQFFGEIALLLSVPRTATVKAVTPTTLFSLALDDFQHVLDKHPKLNSAVYKEARRRMQQLKTSLLQQRQQSIVIPPTETVASECDDHTIYTKPLNTNSDGLNSSRRAEIVSTSQPVHYVEEVTTDTAAGVDNSLPTEPQQQHAFSPSQSILIDAITRWEEAVPYTPRSVRTTINSDRTSSICMSERSSSRPMFLNRNRSEGIRSPKNTDQKIFH